MYRISLQVEAMDIYPPDAPPSNTPPSDAPLSNAPPSNAPPSDAPPSDAPPSNAPPSDAPPSNAPPSYAPSSSAPQHDCPPTNAAPHDALPGQSQQCQKSSSSANCLGKYSTTIGRLFQSLPDDIGDWPDPKDISDELRCNVVRNGFPKQFQGPFPQDDSDVQRRFAVGYYTRKMANEEIVPRSWLIYSVKQDKIFCVCCMLFDNLESPFRSGMSTWEGLSKKLKDHETGRRHSEAFAKWANLYRRLTSETAIDHIQLTAFLKERDFWRQVLVRLIDICLFLAQRNLAFRGSDEVLDSTHNGNFLGLFDLMAKRDPILSELKQRIQDKTTKDHYLSPQIQNEVLSLIASKIREVNLTAVKQSKYYAIILDCTPDLSHNEQLTVILRYVDIRGVDVHVKESFFGYLNVSSNTSGAGLLDAFLKHIEYLNLDIKDCRAQSYDNGSNMKGKNVGLQARILKMNSKALYLPCSSHSLNLVICDAVKASLFGLNFFGLLSKLFNLFSASPWRWEILKNHVPITLKRQSDTRWESRVEAVKPLRFYLPHVIEALLNLKSTAEEKIDAETMEDSEALLTKIKTFQFILSVIIWYDLLFNINKTSKILQEDGASLPTLKKEIETTISFTKNYRDDFDSVKSQAKELAVEAGIEEFFLETRVRRKTKLFNYECPDEPSRSAEDRFRVDFFITLIDTISSSLSERFDQMKKFSEFYGFLYDREALSNSVINKEIRHDCHKLHETLSDIEEYELLKEVERFHQILTSNPSLTTATDFLNYVNSHGLVGNYPNLSIALRMLLTTPISVASAERSFSKLKLIKTFLRTTMSDNRLSDLATISIEHEAAKGLDLDALVMDFASAKARRKHL